MFEFEDKYVNYPDEHSKRELSDYIDFCHAEIERQRALIERAKQVMHSLRRSDADEWLKAASGGVNG